MKLSIRDVVRAESAWVKQAPVLGVYVPWDGRCRELAKLADEYAQFAAGDRENDRHLAKWKLDCIRARLQEAA